jgi:hypothetical protein
MKVFRDFHARGKFERSLMLHLLLSFQRFMGLLIAKIFVGLI